jgi:hypothetical protein
MIYLSELLIQNPGLYTLSDGPYYWVYRRRLTIKRALGLVSVKILLRADYEVY